MPVPGDPRFDDLGAEPNVVVILARIVAAINVKSRSISLREANEVGRADLIDKAVQRPAPISARLVTRKRIHQEARPVLDAVDLIRDGVHEGPRLGGIVGTTKDFLAGRDDPLFG